MLDGKRIGGDAFTAGGIFIFVLDLLGYWQTIYWLGKYTPSWFPGLVFLVAGFYFFWLSEHKKPPELYSYDGSPINKRWGITKHILLSIVLGLMCAVVFIIYSISTNDGDRKDTTPAEQKPALNQLSLTRPKLGNYIVGAPFSGEVHFVNHGSKAIELYQRSYTALILDKTNVSGKALEEIIWSRFIAEKDMLKQDRLNAPPEQDLFFSFSTQDLTADYIKKLREKTKPIYILGTFNYIDDYGIERNLDYCWHVTGEPIYLGLCANHNGPRK